MTKEQVLRLLELRIESEGRESGLTAAEKQEYDRLWAVLDAWDPEAPPYESAAFKAICLNWSDLFRYWHDRALRSEGQRNLAEETLTRVETERLAAIQERDELRQELRDYGEHDASCPRKTQAFHGSLSAGVLHERGGGELCTCGLENLLSAPAAKEQMS